jgi:hypothetical protein
MEPRYRARADVLRLGIVAGYRSIAEAVKWADDIIATDPAPPAAIIDVALGGRQDRSGMTELLTAVPGESDPVDAARELLAQLLDELHGDRFTPDAVAKLVYNLVVLGHLPEDPFGLEPWSLEEDFALVRDGIYGSYDDATVRLERYLTIHAAKPAA